MRRLYIYLVLFPLALVVSCVKSDLEFDMAKRTTGTLVRAFLETPETKADLALGSADGYTNPVVVVDEFLEEKDSLTRFQDVKFPYRDEVYEREQATKVTIANNGSMAFSYGDKIAYCISNGSSTSYNVSTIDLTEGGFPESLPSGYSRCNYAIYPASARGTNYTAPTVVYADTYDLDDATDEETFSWAPMVGRNNGESVSFYHVGGVLRLKCALIPAGAAKIRVTFNGMSYVTGTYSVSNPGTTSASTALVSGSRNYVEFTKDSFGNKATMNIPLPSGSYADCTGITVEVFNGSGASLGSQTCSWWLKEVVRGSGLKLSLLLGEVAIYNAAQTLWKGSTFNYVGGVSGDGVTWSSSNTSVATVNQSGVVTAVGRGEANIILSVDEIGKSVSCMVYVNEVTNISILQTTIGRGYSKTFWVDVIINGSSPSSTTSGTKYGNASLFLYAGYNPFITVNNTPSILSITFIEPPYNSMFELGQLNGIAEGTGSVTVTLPANTYGVHNQFSSTCSFPVVEPLLIDYSIVSYSPSPLNYGLTIFDESDFTATTATSFSASCRVTLTYRGVTNYYYNTTDLVSRISSLGDSSIRIGYEIELCGAEKTLSYGSTYYYSPGSQVSSVSFGYNPASSTSQHFSFNQSVGLISGYQFIRLHFSIMDVSIPMIGGDSNLGSSAFFYPVGEHSYDYFLINKQ